MAARLPRRDFVLKTAEVASAVGIASIVPRRVLGGPRQIPPSEKMNVAGIGVGGIGGANLANLKSENIVALCDVDAGYAAPTIRKYPKAKFYADYREMLDRQKDIDGVVIATPDHTHAVISMAIAERTACSKDSAWRSKPTAATPSPDHGEPSSQPASNRASARLSEISVRPSRITVNRQVGMFGLFAQFGAGQAIQADALFGRLCGKTTVHLGRYPDHELPAVPSVCDGLWDRLAMGLHVGHGLANDLPNASQCGFRRPREPTEAGELGAKPHVLVVLSGPNHAIGVAVIVKAHAPPPVCQ